jgi:hypothetical protein
MATQLTVYGSNTFMWKNAQGAKIFIKRAPFSTKIKKIRVSKARTFTT